MDALLLSDPLSSYYPIHTLPRTEANPFDSDDSDVVLELADDDDNDADDDDDEEDVDNVLQHDKEFNHHHQHPSSLHHEQGNHTHQATKPPTDSHHPLTKDAI